MDSRFIEGPNLHRQIPGGLPYEVAKYLLGRRDIQIVGAEVDDTSLQPIDPYTSTTLYVSLVGEGQLPADVSSGDLEMFVSHMNSVSGSIRRGFSEQPHRGAVEDNEGSWVVINDGQIARQGRLTFVRHAEGMTRDNVHIKLFSDPALAMQALVHQRVYEAVSVRQSGIQSARDSIRRGWHSITSWNMDDRPERPGFRMTPEDVVSSFRRSARNASY